MIRKRALARLLLCLAVAVSILFGAGYEEATDDPSADHWIDLPMPRRLNVRRTESRISDSFDVVSLRKVRVAVDKDMYIGVRDEIRVYRRGDRRPQQAARVSLSSGAGFLKSTDSWSRTPDGIPVRGTQYRIEHNIVVFETTVPPQHMWSPLVAGQYGALWKEKLRADSR